MLSSIGLPTAIVKLAQEIAQKCASCRRFQLPKHKAKVKATVTVRFNERVQADLFLLVEHDVIDDD